MKISLLVTSFNSQTQAVYALLKEASHKVVVTYAINEEQMLQEIQAFDPELILCPFLKDYIPPSIYEAYATYIFHPGPKGDRGPNALEYALQSSTQMWGVTVIRANCDYDGGNIYAQENFLVRDTYKASLYRQEVVYATLSILKYLFINIQNDVCTPQLMNPIHPHFTQAMRSIDWSQDTSEMIIKKIHLSDSLPGVLDEIAGVECYLLGAHKEDKFRGEPKEVLAKRDGAICIGTLDGAIWISHLQEIGGYKLPATYVLKKNIQGVKEERIPLVFDKSYETFYEVSVEKKDTVAYLHFNFHNGAMSTGQCIRLKYAVDYLKEECEVLVLMGGEDFFSNGIHLNILEDSAKQGEDGWANINAMNDLVSSILYAEEVITISSFHRNAGAGGVFMGLACDYVVGREEVILNPHYKSLGLTGSEYHTYSLVKRVGEKLANTLLDECLPLSTSYAKEINMLDEVFTSQNYEEQLHDFAQGKISDEYLWNKEDYIEENRATIESLKEKELAIMHPEFWDEKSIFHTLRSEFVYKVCPRETPQRLKESVCTNIA